MSTSLSTGRRFALLLAAAAMLFAMLPTAPADAGTAAAAVQGEATLNDGVGATNGTGSFEGTAVGVHGTAPGIHVAEATFTYSDELIVTGTANGTLTIDGDSCGFTWIRVGVTAVVTFSGGSSGCTGAAVAGFAPTTPPGSVPAKAVVAGTGGWTH